MKIAPVFGSVWLLAFAAWARAQEETPEWNEPQSDSHRTKFVDMRHLQTRLLEGDLMGAVDIKFLRNPPDVIKKCLGLVLSVMGCSGTVGRIFSESSDSELEAEHIAFDLDLFYRIECDTDEASTVGLRALEAIKALSDAMDFLGHSMFGVESVEPQFRIYTAEVTTPEPEGTDDGFVDNHDARRLRGAMTNYFVDAFQEHNNTTFQRELQASSNDNNIGRQRGALNRINIMPAWNRMRSVWSDDTWMNCVTHVLDSGWDPNHPDLRGNTWINPEETCNDGRDNGDAQNKVDDCHGWNFPDNSKDIKTTNSHGAHCAGTIAARTNNNQGVAGVAGGWGNNRGCAIMAGLGFGRGGQGGFENSLRYAGDFRVAVSSNSWAYGTGQSFLPTPMKNAIDYTTSRGVVVIFAAGNNDITRPVWPAAYGGVVAVAAVRNDGRAVSKYNTNNWWGTNRGSWVNCAAPGYKIHSTLVTGYGDKSGTSMAAPHVAGIVAMGKALDPNASRNKLTNCLYSTSDNADKYQDSRDPDDFRGQLGYGIVDAGAFLECVKPESSSTPGPTPAATPPPTPAATPPPTPVATPPPTPTVWNLRLSDDFEKPNGWGNWIDSSGSGELKDAAHRSGKSEYQCDGAGSDRFTIRLRVPNSASFMTSTAININGSTRVQLAFDYRARQYQSSDYFQVQVRYNGSGSFNPIPSVGNIRPSDGCHKLNAEWPVSANTMELRIRTFTNKPRKHIYVDNVYVYSN